MRKNKQNRTNGLSRRALLETLEERRLLASIAGTVYEDFNANGIQETGDPLQGDPALASTRVYIDANVNGIWDAGELRDLTAADGLFEVTGVPIGNWKLRVEKPAPTWKFITPTTVDGSYDVSIPANDTIVTERDFGLNGPPKLFAPATAQIPEQQTTIDLGHFRDAASDGPWTITVNWGDVSNTVFAQLALGGIVPVNHAYADNGQYTVTVTASDQFGVTGATTFPLTVANVAPTANLVNSGPIVEGQQATISFAGAFDPSPADTAAGFTYSFDLDNDGTYDIIDSTQSFVTQLYTENKRQTITAQIKDKDGGLSTYATDVVINNVAPTLAVSGAPSAFAGQVYTIDLSAIDPGEDTIISWIINWGDGTSSTLPGTAAQAAHIYGAPGVYTINAAATDDDSSASNPYYWAPPVAVNVTIPSGGIFGMVINDVDGNGKQSARELGAGNRIVYLDYDYNGVWSVNEPQALTTAAGAYTFTNLPVGSYRVQLAMPKKWLSSNPSTGYRDIYVGAGQTAISSFWMTTRSRATGKVFLDANRNRRLDSKDKGLKKWRVFIDKNDDGWLNKGELWAYTDATGTFVLNGLTRGTHALRVLMPRSGYSLTSPGNEDYILKAGLGQTIRNRNFGTVRIKG